MLVLKFVYVSALVSACLHKSAYVGVFACVEGIHVKKFKLCAFLYKSGRLNQQTDRCVYKCTKQVTVDVWPHIVLHSQPECLLPLCVCASSTEHVCVCVCLNV